MAFYLLAVISSKLARAEHSSGELAVGWAAEATLTLLLQLNFSKLFVGTQHRVRDEASAKGICALCLHGGL